MANIDLNNFKVVKFGDPDSERNYINDILHALADRINEVANTSAETPLASYSFLTAILESGLANARVLAGESGVVQITDNGGGSALTVGIADNGIDNTKLAQMPAQTFKANKEVTTGNPEDITGTEATALLDVFTDTEKGLVPPPGVSPAAGWYLHFDGTWSTPGGGSSTVASVNSGTGIDVDNTDPSNPIVNLADTAVTPGTYGDGTHIATFAVDQQGRLTSAGQIAVTIPVGANPSASVGLSAVNGAASTFMRSDAAPPIDVTIAPTWVGIHTFDNQTVFNDEVHVPSNQLEALILRSLGNTHVGVDLQVDGNSEFLGAVTADANITLAGVISPTALASGNTNNWNPTGLATASVIRVTTNAAGSTLTGITAPSVGQVIYLLNLGSGTLTLSNQSLGSTATNRLILGSTTVILSSGQGARLFYDTTTQRWRFLGSSTSGSSTIVRTPSASFDGGGSALSGTLVREIYFPFSGTITDWTIIGDVSGSCSIAVSNATYANYDTMTSLLTATCTTAKKNQSTGLSVAVSAGVIRFSAGSFSGFNRCSIVLSVTT